MDTNAKEIRTLYFDLLFCLFLILLLVVFFVAAKDYSWASKRAPFVIMVPLVFMTAGQTWAVIAKIRRMRNAAAPGAMTLKLDPRDVSKGSQILIWLVMLLVFFYVAGHLGGTALFLFVFLRFVSRESLRTAAFVAIGVTASVYILFERILMISLYEGWIYYLISDWFYS
jgi:hypothetical protein